MLLFLSFVGVVFASCPNLKVEPNFNATRYLGDWFEIAISPFTEHIIERECVCTRAQYSARSNVSVGVFNSCNKKSPDGPPSNIRGYAYIPDPETPAKLKVVFPSAPIAGNYWIMWTDYDQAAIIWSCVQFGPLADRTLWILARQPQISATLYTQLAAKAQAITGYDVSKLMKTPQPSSCQYPASGV